MTCKSRCQQNAHRYAIAGTYVLVGDGEKVALLYGEFDAELNVTRKLLAPVLRLFRHTLATFFMYVTCLSPVSIVVNAVSKRDRELSHHLVVPLCLLGELWRDTRQPCSCTWHYYTTHLGHVDIGFSFLFAGRWETKQVSR